MKTHITISIDVDVAVGCKEKPQGFTSKICNEALRDALKIPETEQQKERRKKNNPDRLYVPGIGFVSKNGG